MPSVARTHQLDLSLLYHVMCNSGDIGLAPIKRTVVKESLGW